jgi:hypothetical protein
VQSCLSTWTRRNPDWEVRSLTADTIGDYVEADLPLNEGPPAALSDICRIFILREFGGVWVDSTLYCAAPLDSWLDDRLAQGFFAFARPGPDRMLASWFLAAQPQHPIVTAWADLVAEYWRDRTKPDRYFWFHYLFADAYQQDPALRRAWDAVPKLSANGPHYFAPHYERRLSRRLRPHVRQRLLSGVDPVYKLTHRIGDITPSPGSTYEFLQSWAEDPLPMAQPSAPSRRLAVHVAADQRFESLRWNYLNARQRMLLLLRRAG